MARLQLGATLNADVIKEGDDVYFDCDVRANPEAVRLQWRQEVSRNESNRIQSKQTRLLHSPLMLSFINVVVSVGLGLYSW